MHYTVLLLLVPKGLQVKQLNVERFKSMSTRGPGRGDTCHLTDFSETWPD